jgi:pimeloyl-ACP methyl ester carboxylesterase
MTTFVLIPGAGGVAWYWSRVALLLEAAGHRAVPVELPADDETAGLPEYVDTVLAALSATADVTDGQLVVVAQSLGGCTAPLVATRVPVSRIVLVNAMIPMPGERVGDWWEATGSGEARLEAARRGGYSEEFDLDTYFLHDVPPEVAAEGEPYQRDQTDTVFGSVVDIDAWPDVPTQVLVGADDRFFPADFQARVARDRLGVEADVIPGGHLLALADPQAVADYLLVPTHRAGGAGRAARPPR